MSGIGTREDYNALKLNVDQDALKSIGKDDDLVGAIDQGTSSTRFVVFSSKGRIVASAQMEHRQIFPEGKVGWHEHDPLEIWRNTCACIDAVAKANNKKPKCVGITNQRETTVAWDAETGKPYYNAIVWDDVRTTSIASAVAQGNVDRLRDQTGLPLASYFAGTKVKWLLDHIPQLQTDLQDDKKRANVRFGTIDTWLMYQLTGNKSLVDGAANVGGMFMTDVSNASRWLFLDISSVKWDQGLVDTVCAPHSVPVASALPEIRSSSEVYATCSADCGVAALDGVPLASVLGDQQAALFGQVAFAPGQAKNTYGTGLFLMMNTGTNMVKSTHGLLTTVAFRLGDDDVVYALEGSVSHSGSTIQWLRDQLRIISDAAESEVLATEQNDGLYLVPAFAGLFAPHWRFDARACIVGMTATHHRGHVCRAALEATAYQTKEVFDAMYADSGVKLTELRVDGGASNNKLLMQFQSDMIGVDVVRPLVMETTSMGAAFAAGLAVGVWQDTEEIASLWEAHVRFQPTMDSKERTKYWNGWNKAIQKSMGWVEEEMAEAKEEMKKVMEKAKETLEEVQQDTIPGLLSSTYSIGTVGMCSLVALTVGIMIGRARTHP